MTRTTRSLSGFAASLHAVSLACVLGIWASTAIAEGPPDGPPSLPPEAYTSCDAKASGDACTAHLRSGDVDGTCAPDRDGKRLFCRPNGPPPAPPRESTSGAAPPASVESMR